MTSTNWGSREPRVPPAVGALGALVNKAELLELLWFSWTKELGRDEDTDALVELVFLINARRRALDPIRGLLDASNLKGHGVLALRRVCGRAAALANQAAATAEKEESP